MRGSRCFGRATYFDGSLTILDGTPREGDELPMFRYRRYGALFVLFSLNFCHQELLKASATEVRLETRVTGVVGSIKAGYSLIGGAQDKLGTFDAVVIAAPLGLAGIALDVRGEVRSWCHTFTWQQQRFE